MMTDENDIIIQPPEDESPTASKETPSVVDAEPIIEETAMTNETAVPPPLPPPPPPTEPTPVSQRRGCVLLFLGAILGAIMGTVLTLAILLGLNGSLTFTSTDAQLRRAINDTRIEQEDMLNEMATRSAHIDYMATQVGGVAADQNTVNEAMSTVDVEMNGVMAVVTAVDAQVSDLDERIDTTEEQLEGAATAAAEFNTFLGGLKELLSDEDPATPTPQATDSTVKPTATNDGDADDATLESDETNEPTRTVRPTRTPRPTSTSLPQITPTAEP